MLQTVILSNSRGNSPSVNFGDDDIEENIIRHHLANQGKSLQAVLSGAHHETSLAQ